MQSDHETLKAAQQGDEHAFERLVAPLQRELRAYCYRMAGSLHDADDLLQESLLKAWKGLPGFKSRSSLRTWLYRVTTNACLDALAQRKPRILPMDLGPPTEPNEPMRPPAFDLPWLDPCPADLYASPEPSPETRCELNDSVRLAFLVAIQTLPPKQRAALILRDAIGIPAAECAALLDWSVPAVNSALQRARTAIADRAGPERVAPITPDDEALLSQYVLAWEHADVEALVAVLAKDARLAMPPLSQWLVGREAIAQSIQGMVFAPAGPGNFRLFRVEANGAPAFAVYQRDPEEGTLRAMGIHVFEFGAERIAAITAFLNPSLLPLFGWPLALDADGPAPDAPSDERA